ncbi:MarR family winged helix-turn-helix transcriptional regulator [Cryptosporangium phraense]|uniref:MarR family transcriptional regulator n=1 Tax=Cryptosporangium phraense TaxID=2593070 RepID=A0A545AP58_9ACTN|nr:MarR family transcriptional regulator [Cryptosporangium phraense]TQS43041.1 MarR family transcriptional regulator [Cryptosporangium phraense]
MEQNDELVDALMRSAFAVMAVLNTVGAELDLSLTQLRVLGILRDRPPVRMATLAEHLGLDRSTMTGLVDRAEKRGLLVRRPSPTDGRAVEVSIAPGSVELVESTYRRVVEAVTPLVADLKEADRRRLRTLLEQVGS